MDALFKLFHYAYTFQSIFINQPYLHKCEIMQSETALYIIHYLYITLYYLLYHSAYTIYTALTSYDIALTKISVGKLPGIFPIWENIRFLTFLLKNNMGLCT